MHNRQDITETNLKPALLEGETAGSHDHTHSKGWNEERRLCFSVQQSDSLSGDSDGDVRAPQEPAGRRPRAEGEGQAGDAR